MADRVLIADLHLRCVIGANEWERNVLQDVLINIEMTVDTRPAAASDDLVDAVDYRAITKRVIAMVEDSAFHLVEALAEEIAGICLEDDRVTGVQVRVEKPGALRFARSVGIEIERGRDG
jgi:dihydroneopterin aldolase/D-erythro-7,8-dihydroneopterin triphosphate epimerase